MQHALRILTRVHLGLLYGLGWFVHAIIYHVLRWRRDQVESDVAQAFPAKTADARAEIVRASYRNLADVVVETLWGFTASAEELRRRVAFENPEVVDRCAAAKHSVVLLTPHFCNWEWLLLAGGATFGLPIDAVYQTVRVRFVDEFLLRARSRFGGQPFPRQDFVYELMARADTPRAYGLIADQTPPRDQRKHWTRMLNRDTAFYVGAESITRFLDATVLYVDMRRVRKGHYAVRFTVLAEPPYGPDAKSDDTPIMEAFARQLERAVIERPAQWLWVQKRWKYPKTADA